MSGVNKVMVLGYVGQSPRVNATKGGEKVANFSVATKWGEETEWHSIVAFGKTAEIVDEYVKKGSQVHVEGRLRTRTYTSNDGVEKKQTEIIAFTVTLLGKKGDTQEADDGAPAAPPPAQAPRHADPTPDDDIPF